MMSICLGYVARAFGIKGGLVVKSYGDHAGSFVPGNTVVLENNKDQKTAYTITSYQDGRLFLHDVTSRTEAELLVGARIVVERQDLPTLAEDEFYLADLHQALVQTCQGEEVGRVVGFSSNNAQHLLQVLMPCQRMASIPMIRPIVTHIDYASSIITIDPPEGLLELEA